MATSKAWITRRSCAWRRSIRPLCGWNAASASLWFKTPHSPRWRWRFAGIGTHRRVAGGLQHPPPSHGGTGSAFGIRQIVDMALRTLSPGINDTTTAVMCVDYLTAILARLAVRPIPSTRRHQEGELRVITIGPTFAGLSAESFDQIRASAKGNVAVTLRLLDAIEIITGLTASARAQSLRHGADIVYCGKKRRELQSPETSRNFAHFNLMGCSPHTFFWVPKLYFPKCRVPGSPRPFDYEEIRSHRARLCRKDCDRGRRFCRSDLGATARTMAAGADGNHRPWRGQSNR